MNKIYKVIYSKVRQCYVVVSEIAKSHGRHTHSSVAKSSSALTAAVLIALGAVSFSALPTAQAAGDLQRNDFVAANDYYWYWDAKANNGNGEWKKEKYSDLLIGNRDSKATSNYKGAGAKDPGAITAGVYAQAGEQTVTIGNRNAGESKGSVFIGEHSGYNNGTGNNALGDTNNYVTSVGFESDATGWGSIAIGSNATATNSKKNDNVVEHDGNENTTNNKLDDAYGILKNPTIEGASVALGYSAKAQDGNIAIGAYSEATDTSSATPYVSVGNSKLQRRITNVADGAAATDVATVGQLQELSKELGGYKPGFGIKIDPDSTDTKKNTISLNRNLGRDMDSTDKATLEADANKNALVLGGRVNSGSTSGGQTPEKDYGALGQDSVTVGGADNTVTANGDAAVVVGGLSNKADAQYSTVVGGSANDAAGNESSVFGGFDNDAYGTYATLSGGSMNKAYGDASSVFGGYMNNATGASSVAIGGSNSFVTGLASVGIAGGSTTADNAFAAGNGANVTVNNGTAIGYQATANKEGTVAFGHDAGDANYSASTTWKQKATKEGEKYYDDHHNEITEAQYEALRNADNTFNDYSQPPTYSQSYYNRLVKVADGVDPHDVVVMEQLSKAQNDLKVNAGWGINIEDVTTKDENGKEMTKKNVISLKRNLGKNYGSRYGTGKVNFEADGENSLILGGGALNDSWEDRDKEVTYGAHGKDSILVGGLNNDIAKDSEKVATSIGTKASIGTRAVIIGGTSNTVSYDPVTEKDPDTGKEKVKVDSNGNVIVQTQKTGTDAIIVGGLQNTAKGDGSVLIGGESNEATGFYSTVIGGTSNKTDGWLSSIFGGTKNTITGAPTAAGIFGGTGNTINSNGIAANVFGGENNTADNTLAVVVGGETNTSSGPASIILGGNHNTANQLLATVVGGQLNTATGETSMISGGIGNVTSGAYSYDAGGLYNRVTGMAASSLGGLNSSVNGMFSTGVAGGSTGENAILSLAAGYQSVVTNSGVEKTYVTGDDAEKVLEDQYSGKELPGYYTRDWSVDYGPGEPGRLIHYDKFATALGYQATADEYGTIAFGHDAGDESGYTYEWEQLPAGKYAVDGTTNDYSKAPKSVKKKDPYTSSYYNRLVKVADGIDDHDVVVMEQLNNSKTHFYSVNSKNTTAGNYNNDGATGKNALAAGVGAAAKGDNSVAIGTSTSTGTQAIAIGEKAKAGNQGIAVGANAFAVSSDNMALGNYASVESGVNKSTAIGYGSKVTKRDILPTDNGTYGSDGVVSVGRSVGQSGEPGITRRIINVRAGVNDTDAVNVSQLKEVQNGLTHFYSVKSDGVTTGNYNNDGAKGTNSLAAGVSAVANGGESVAVGSHATAGSNAMAIGSYAKAENNSTAIGTHASATSSQNLAIGYYANVTGRPDKIKNSVALGASSTVGEKDILDTDNGYGVLSIGAKDKERRIIHVRAGVNDTDAVNVSQLKSAQNDLTDKGITFAANSGAEYTAKLGGKVKIQGTDNKKAGHEYTADNLTTEIDKDGNITILMDKDMSVEKLAVNGKDGKDGAPGSIGISGQDGKSGIGIDGKDGISIKGKDGKDGVTIKAVNGKNGTEGHIGLTGPKGTNGKDGTNAIDITVKNGYDDVAKGINGTNGVDGKDGITRIVYTDKTGEHQVATLEDGLKFKGDDTTVISKKLNNTLDIIGGADSKSLTEKNIGVNSDKDGKLNVQLAKDLTGITSISNQTTTKDGDKEVTTGAKITLGTDGSVDVNKGKITNVGSGIEKDGEGNITDASKTNAANIGDVQTIAENTATSLTGKGLKFAANSGDEYTAKLGSTVKIQGTDKKDGHEYTADNLTTEIDKDGNIKILMDKDMSTETLAVNGKDGKAGQPGTAGSIGISGRDGKAGVGIDGKDGISIKGHNGKDGVTIKGIDGVDGVDGAEGHIGLNGKDGMTDIFTTAGKPGLNGKDGETMTRIVYKDPKGTEHEAATLDDGLKFKGDDSKEIAKKLNNTMEIIGGADSKTLTEGNIGVNSTDKGQLKVQLAKDLKGITSISNQKTTKVEGKDVTTGAKIDLGDDGSVNVNGGKITNVGSGIEKDGNGKYTVTDQNKYNAANVGDVQNIVNDAKKDLTEGANGLNKKANVDASNIGTNLKNADGSAASTDAQKANAEKWGSAIGTGEIKADDGRMVTGKTVYDEVRPTADGSYVKKDKTTGENLSALDTKIGSLDKDGNYIKKDDSISNNLSTLDTQAKTNTDAIKKNSDDITNINKSISSLDQNAVKYDDTTKGKVTLAGGEGGTTITNVKDGTLSDSSTEAVNGKQLYNEQQAREAADKAITEKVTNNTNEITKIKNGDFTDASKTAIHNIAKDAVAVVNGKNTTVTKVDGTDTTPTTYAVNVEGTGKVAAGDTGLISGDTLYKEVHIDKDGAYIKGSQSVGQNLSNLDTGLKTTSDLIHTNAKGDTIQIGGNSTATKIDISGKDKDGKSTGRVITGVVSDVNDPNSAANVGYVNGITSASNEQIYHDMNMQYNHVENDISRAAAGSNALAALHPMQEFDPDDKAQFALGYGHYRNSNAGAVGAFYQPDENSMVNFGVSFGNGDAGINAGVTFKFGPGGSGHHALTKTQMAKVIDAQSKEIDELKKDNADKDKRIDALEQKMTEILAKLDKSKD